MTRSGATPSRIPGAAAVRVGLDIRVDDLAQPPHRLGHGRVGHPVQFGHDHPGCSHQHPQMLPAGLRDRCQSISGLAPQNGSAAARAAPAQTDPRPPGPPGAGTLGSAHSYRPPPRPRSPGSCR